MINVWAYSLVSVLIVSLISLLGVITLFFNTNSIKNILLYLVSFSAGALFGDAFIHLLPEVVKESGFGINISVYVLMGILLSFIVEKGIRWRHCHVHDSEHIHGSKHFKNHKNHENHHPFALMNLFGDGVHNFIDGLIIGASYLVSVSIGVTTTVAVILHEIPQEIGDFGVLLHGGFSRNKALLFNFLSAITSFAGVIFALLLSSYVNNISAFLIPLAAGGFIYIAGADLIPELHKEASLNRSLLQLIAFVLGIFIMILFL